MTEAKHTPGNWEVRKALHPVDDAFDYAIGADIDDHKYCIAEAFGRCDEGVYLPAEANARLIAAAPELLEALKEASVEIARLNKAAGETVFNPAATDLVRAAIAKADGEVE